MTTEEGATGESSWSEALSAEEMRGRLAGLSTAELVARWSAGDEYDDYYEAVARELYEQGEPGIEVLTQELAGRRVPQLRAALTVLAMHQGSEVAFVEKVKLLAGDSEPVIAGDAIRLLGSLGITELGERIRGMGDHPSPFVRASVLDYLARAEPESAYPALVQGLRDSDYVVRETAVDALDDLDSTESISAIEPLLEDPHEDVRLAARTAVDNLRDRAGSAG
ncbi:HEAT repeat domain-containing protein [Nocardia sp. NBC_01329]|uniref:HEAT repeat domain-containing protein n=1 Tax=Nocardia sp. NBC_01329 TaxID=2903594 RepID=UPI002E13568D|nr:HEAT repeat domain-containing protein [Nocardia sp. NBC_01329]